MHVEPKEEEKQILKEIQLADELNVGNLRESVPITDEKRAIEKKATVQGSICTICLANPPDNQPFTTCNHKFCTECIKDHLIDSITNGRVQSITCPEIGCQSEFTEEIMRKYIPEELIAKYKKFKMDLFIINQPNMTFCIRPNCGKIVQRINEKEAKVMCECGKVFCFKCHDEWHEGQSCEEKWSKQFNLYAEDSEVKKCPKCQVAIQKNLGCNHMTCTKCKYQFCWLCRRTYNSSHYA